MFTYKGFFVDLNAMVSPIFLIKIVSAVFEIFRKKRIKKTTTLFSCTITILDHTMYGKVKRTFLFHARFHPIGHLGLK